MMWGWPGYGPDGGLGWVAMSLFMLAFWAVLIGLWVWAVKQFRPSDTSPLSILEHRLARGDIDREEFEQRKALLSQR